MSVRQAGVLGPNPSLHPTGELKRSADESEFMIESLYSNARLYDLMYPQAIDVGSRPHDRLRRRSYIVR